ncbi:hypothetical protein P389DRAFT_211357 [Cystobasidium minutum MCA 4210]|uniref:uncharacterized protein n=1 Tax=Cystobasidium minutum MCA 4210 TaxID=1397322 RepID=UPI0034CF1D2A|eukprot:jgi/Rhomi1/211357/estExt_Genemark1.C_4_t30028
MLRLLNRQVTSRVLQLRPHQPLVALRSLHASSSQSVDQSSSSSSAKSSSEAAKPASTATNKPAEGKRKLSARERDEAMMQRMKERMGQEGDEAWEDGRPPESGLPRNVKNNMFRLI